MPIIRCSDQKSKTLEEFYSELKTETSTIVENEIGKSMLQFICMVNETFTETIIYGLTSHYSLVIQSKDKWESDWFVTVYSIGDKKFQFEYQVPERKAPWKYATIKGQANTIEEAKDYLIIAMTESEGWAENKELKKLYNKVKNLKANNTKFNLWLEFEEVEANNWDIKNDATNIHVDLEDGRHYGLNVWTYKFLETIIVLDKETGQNLNGLYQNPPDLFVQELTRECIQQTIEELLKMGDLETVLNEKIRF